MNESRGHRRQETSDQEIRDHYVGALGFPQELQRGDGTTQVSTPELGEMAYEQRARELGAPLLPDTKDLPPFADK